MKIKKEHKVIIINSLISIFAILLASFSTYYFTKNSEIESRKYYNDKETLKIILQDSLKYSDYSLVDWDEIAILYRIPYHCDWKYNKNLKDKNIDSLIEKNYPSNGVACSIYGNLQNAKKDFRKITTEARIIGSDEVLFSIQEIEDGFDEVFIQIVSEKYYSRIFIDQYNEVIPDSKVRKSSLRASKPQKAFIHKAFYDTHNRTGRT